jgi:hypothetical protein
MAVSKYECDSRGFDMAIRQGLGQGNDRESAQKDAGAQSESEPTRSRKPYQKPAFRYERVFETMALACGKMNATQSHCRFNRKTS